jgi:hypothetical protein
VTIFLDRAFDDCPLLIQWQIVGGRGKRPRLVGLHSFHEGTRATCEDLLVLDPMMCWAITTKGGYRLGGWGTDAYEWAKYGIEKRN